MKTWVLLSGGLDSVTLLHEIASRDQLAGAISFAYGSKHQERELAMAQWHCTQLKTRFLSVPLHFMNELFVSSLLQDGEAIPDGHYEEETMKSTVVPFRNGIMLAIAAGIVESQGGTHLAIAAHGGDHAIYPDCRETFLQPIATAIEEGTYARIQVLRPFVHMRKEDIVTLGTQLGIDYATTWSCYKGGTLHCGTCGTCVERKEAFAKAGVSDPTKYQQ